MANEKEAQDTNFWKCHEESIPKTKAILEATIARLEDEAQGLFSLISRLKEEKESLEQYVKEQDDEVERLKSSQRVPGA